MKADSDQPLFGRIAVVTGGCGGIGEAICKRLIREGATVYALDLAEPTNSDVKYRKHDVTCEQSAIDLLKHIQNHHDRLDILVNAAGIEIEKTIEETTLDEWNRIFAINVSGTFLTSKYTIPLMRRTGGSIVNFGSYDGFIADPKLAAYCATKGAVHALTRAMACDHGPDNIRVNVVCPGFIDTPMLKSFFGEGSDSDRYYQAAREIHPIHRHGTPEDVANLVFWLASDESTYATGQLWVLDGGLTAQAQQMRL